MIVKFFPHSTGDGIKPVNYFLGINRDRDFARVISGDPVITQQLISATPYEHSYKSGVLSFTERADEISEEDKLRLMREFEKTLFPGLEPDQYDILWIEHADKDIDTANPVGRLELNFLIPCMELRSGKRLQPYYAGADKPRVDAWKNIINREVKTIDGESLSDPNAPSRKRKTHNFIGASHRPSPYDIKPKRLKSEDDLVTSSRDALRESINQHMLAVLAERNDRLGNREDVVHELSGELQLTIERTVLSSITITHEKLLDKNGKSISVRLEGGIYHKDFDANDFKPAAQSEYEKNAIRRKLRDDHTYNTAMALKTEYHRELYAKSELPLPLDIQHMIVTTAEQAPVEGTQTQDYDLRETIAPVRRRRR